MMDIGDLNTREKQALGALCLSAFCGHFGIAHSAIEELVAHEVSLLAAASLPDWERAGAELRVTGRGDPIPEGFLAAVPPELSHSLLRLVEDSVEIGITDMYGANTDRPQKYLQKAMDLLKAHGVPVPQTETVKMQPKLDCEEWSGWGKPAPQEVCERILDCCMTLLRGRV